MQLMFFDGRTHKVQEMLVAINITNFLKTEVRYWENIDKIRKPNTFGEIRDKNIPKSDILYGQRVDLTQHNNNSRQKKKKRSRQV